MNNDNNEGNTMTTELHCDTMGDNPELVSPADIKARFELLSNWPKSWTDAVYNDPRCGCAEDGAGEKCWWDDTWFLETL